MIRPCPSCKAGAARQGLAFESGYLQPSRDYPLLLRCSVCGTYTRPDEDGAVLVTISAASLAQYRGVSIRPAARS
jgi:hypothetical protein